MKLSEIEQRLKSLPHRSATFIEPMECLAATKTPDDRGWVYEVKLDGYRALAVKSEGKLNLFSRRRNLSTHNTPGFQSRRVKKLVQGKNLASDADS